ncbi:Chymotrypsin-like protease CTRL-1 [Atta colombica]|uniref:Chymotrypsin-like protease CTRL-1 n=1 Tax=Atta colombica TaxID=520822 RepID=A0A195BWY0_9HYME|nr:Chymotrypsin-like protease CTRL-1 [Atta colombica]
MCCLLLLLLLPIVTSELCDNPWYQYDTICQNNSLSCPSDQKCVFIEYCPGVVSLMDRNALSSHRLRQAVCGYDRTHVKICCSVNSYIERPVYPDRNLDVSTTQLSSNFQCGRSIVRSNVNILGSYPFVARIGFISKCSVLIGEYNTESNPDCNNLFCGHKTSSHDISYVVKHPGYNAASYSNNVALLRLKKAIEFTATAQPICFIPEDRYVSLGSTCTVVGWGKLLGQKAQPLTQQSLQLELVPKQQCSDYISQALSVELCAKGNCEPCSSYSGSPLLYKYADMYFLVGILSFGSSCDSSTIFPSAFVNVQRYTKWILENS